MTSDEPTPEAPTTPLSTAVVTLIAVAMVLIVTAISVAIFADAARDDEDGGTGPRTAASVTVSDDFIRAGDSDLTTEEFPWDQVSGMWSADGSAHLDQPNPDGPRTLAILPGLGGDGTLSVTAEAVGPGWAVAVRARDQLNYVALVARPADGSWALERVAGGQVTQIPRILVAQPADGDLVQIDLDGPAIRVSVNGEEATVDLAPASRGDAGAGLLSVDGVPSDLAWGAFSFTGRPTTDIPIVTVGPR